MIHVAMPALNSTLINMGLSVELTERVKLTIGMLTLDPTVCLFHTPLEMHLNELIENSELRIQGLVFIDEVAESARELTGVLVKVAARYTALNNIGRASVVLQLTRDIGDSLKWA
jgi:hypothetical protein